MATIDYSLENKDISHTIKKHIMNLASEIYSETSLLDFNLNKNKGGK